MSDEILGDLLQHGQVLQIRPDDALIFKFDRLLTDRVVAEIRARITPQVPAGIRFLIIGRGIDVTVLRQEPE